MVVTKLTSTKWLGISSLKQKLFDQFQQNWRSNINIIRHKAYHIIYIHVFYFINAHK
jgi:hypothetical protein